jgi:quercetin dioxygenase-like cupin family protein
MTLVTEADGYHLDAGEGEELWFAGGLLTHKATGDQTDGQLVVAEVVSPRGTGSPLHLHEREDEAWYVLDGELTFWIGDRKLTASTGPELGATGGAHSGPYFASLRNTAPGRVSRR